MDVGCPKCQTEYELDDARVTEDGVTVKCTTCGHVFRVKKKQLVVTLPSRGEAPNATLGPSSELPPSPPTREWKVRQPSGNLFPCRDLTMLQKWIIEGKVQRHDEISLTGETWKRLGDIPELASFFQIVDDASRARNLEAMARSSPPPPPAPSSPPGPAGRITDTWRGGQFSAPAPDNAVPLEPEGAPRKVTTQRTPQFTPSDPLEGGRFGDAPASVTQTQQGGRFGDAPAPVTQTQQGGRFAAAPADAVTEVPRPPRPPPRRPEPSDEELKRAVKGGGSGKWLFLIFAGLLVGGGVGYYFGVYEPKQREEIEQRATEQAKVDEEARVRALTPAEPPPVAVVVDASVELEDAGQEEEDAGTPDAGFDAGAPMVDAGPPAPVVEPRKSFDQLLVLADRLRNRDKPEQALDLYEQAAGLKPTRVEPLTGRGLALLDMGNIAGAVTTFEQALRLNGRYGPAIMGLAEAYRIQGKNEKAVEYYEKYLDVLPNGVEAPVARNSIERLKK